MSWSMHLRFRDGRWLVVTALVVSGAKLVAQFPRGTRLAMLKDGLIVAAHPDHNHWLLDSRNNEWVELKPCGMTAKTA